MFAWFISRLRHAIRIGWRTMVFSLFNKLRVVGAVVGYGVTMVLFACIAAGGGWALRGAAKWHVMPPNSIIAIWLACLCSALLTGLYFRLRRTTELQNVLALKQRLDRTTAPDNGGYYTARIELKPNRITSFFPRQKRQIPRNCPEILLLAPQVSNSKQKYEIDSVKKQLEDLEAAVQDRGCTLRWVCFTTKHGKFVAYQWYANFRSDIFNKSSNIFLDLLNEPDTAKFVDKLTERAPDPQSVLTWLLPYYFLGQTWFDHVPEGETRRETLSRMLSHTPPLDHAMLISLHNEVPVGIVSVAQLVKDIFGRNGFLPQDRDKAVHEEHQTTGDEGQSSAKEFENLSAALESEGRDLSISPIDEKLPHENLVAGQNYGPITMSGDGVPERPPERTTGLPN